MAPILALTVLTIVSQQTCPTVESTQHALSQELESTKYEVLAYIVGETNVETKDYSYEYQDYCSEFLGSVAFSLYTDGKLLPSVNLNIDLQHNPVCGHLPWIAFLSDANYKSKKTHKFTLDSFTVPFWHVCTIRQVVKTKSAADLYWIKPIGTSGPQPAIWRAGTKLLSFKVVKEIEEIPIVEGGAQ